MLWNQVEGYSLQLLGRLREHWGVMLHRPLDIIGGQRAQIVGKLQRMYGESEISADSISPRLTTPSERS